MLFEAGITLSPEASNPDRRSADGATAVEGSAGLGFGGRVEGEDSLPVTDN